MTKKSKKILYFCVIIIILLEILSISFNADTSILMSNCLYIILIIVSNIGLIYIINLLIKNDKQDYIDVIGLSILAMLFSSLLFKPFANENNSIQTFQSSILLLGSLIRIYIPIIAVIYYEKSKADYKYQGIRKFKKMLAYLLIALISSLLQYNYKLSIEIVLLGVIAIITIKYLEEL